MKKTAIIVMVITLLSKILGFGREMTMSYFYGASPISDAYFVAQSVPSILMDFIGTGLATAYIPMMAKINGKEGKENANKFTVDLLNVVICMMVFVFFLSQLFLPLLIKILAVGFEPALFKTTVAFSRITLIAVFAYGVAHIITGFLQINENYIIPAMMGFALNSIVIASIVISSYFSSMALIIGATIGSVAQVLFMLPWLSKAGLNYKGSINFKNPHIKTTVLMAIPAIVGASANQINTLVDRSIASTITLGGISSLNYASRLNLFIQSLFITSMVVVMYPMLSKMAEEKNIEGMKRSITESFGLINLLLVPITVGAMIFSKEVVTVLFGRGAFDETAIQLTSVAMFFYSIGMLGFGYREVLSKAFYSLHDTRTPVINATIGVSINIVLNFILSQYLGIGGLALATSIAAIVTAVLLGLSLKKKLGSFEIIAKDSVKILGASLVMGAVAKFVFQLLILRLGVMLALVLSVWIAIFVYGLQLKLLKVKEMEELVGIVSRKLLKR